jgi:hypothetical protein
MADDNKSNDKKSKLPDLEELTGIVGKLFGDLKKSVGEIVTDYKDKREAGEAASEAGDTAAKPSEGAGETSKTEKAEAPKAGDDEKD